MHLGFYHSLRVEALVLLSLRRQTFPSLEKTNHLGSPFRQRFTGIQEVILPLINSWGVGGGQGFIQPQWRFILPQGNHLCRTWNAVVAWYSVDSLDRRRHLKMSPLVVFEEMHLPLVVVSGKNAPLIVMALASGVGPETTKAPYRERSVSYSLGNP